jgi:hypothetical protein
MADEFDPPDNDNITESAEQDFFAGRDAARDVDLALQLRGESRQQREIIAQQVYDATDNKDLTRDQRRQAQRDMREAQRVQGWRFDWAAWRREKERRGDKTP